MIYNSISGSWVQRLSVSSNGSKGLKLTGWLVGAAGVYTFSILKRIEGVETMHVRAIGRAYD